MAINTAQEAIIEAPVRIIAKCDDAIDFPNSDWDEYVASHDESKLKFLPNKQPTVFICNFRFDARSAKMVNNAMLAGKDDEGSPSLAYGAWSQMVVKVSLKDVQNPEYVPPDQQVKMHKDANGHVHDTLLGKLERWGVAGDIFNAYIKRLKDTKDTNTLKNS